MDMKITMLEGEHWYGLAAVHGTKFPLNARSSYSWHHPKLHRKSGIPHSSLIPGTVSVE